jgi:hypothetical protein
MRLYLKRDPFNQTTGIEFAKGEHGEELPHIQVCAEAITDATIHEPVPSIVAVEHRNDNITQYSEVFGETRTIKWSLQGTNITLSKGRPLRMNIVWFNQTTSNLYDANSDLVPHKLGQFYAWKGRTGEYRYKLHVEGRDIVPAMAYLHVRWLPRGYPMISLEPIGETLVFDDE